MMSFACLVREPAPPVHGLCRWVARPDLDGNGVLQINNVAFAFSEHRDKGKVTGYRLMNLETEEAHDIDCAWMECTCKNATGSSRLCQHARAVAAALAVLTK